MHVDPGKADTFRLDLSEIVQDSIAIGPVKSLSLLFCLGIIVAQPH